MKMKYIQQWIIVFGLISVPVLIGALDISRDVVYKRGGTLTLLCGFNNLDPYSDIDVWFIWRHNVSVLVQGGPNFKDGKSEETYYNKYEIVNAGAEASGTYTCNVEGKPEAVSTHVQEVLVDETPTIGEFNGVVDMALIKKPTDGIQCYKTQPLFQELPKCIASVTVTEESVGTHTFVIVSSAAIQYYTTIQAAMDNLVTFNTSKTLIGLKINHKEENITFTFSGDEFHLDELRLRCFREPSNGTMIADELETGSSNERMFSCNRNATEPPFEVEVHWKGERLFKKTITNDNESSGAALMKASVLIFFIILVLVHV